MKRDTINYVLVGAFVLAMGAAFLIMMYAISGRTGATETYYTYYRNVTGLKFGTGVFYEGYRVGQVETIEPEGGGADLRYRVELSVLEGWQIPTDSIASILSGGLISAMTIEISAGESADLLSPGDTITGIEQANLFAALSRAANDFGDLSRNGLRPLLDNLNDRITELSNEYVALRRENLAPFVDMLHDNIEPALVKVDDSATNLQRILSDENHDNVSSALRHVDSAAEGFSRLISDLEATRDELHEMIVEIGQTVADNRPAVDASMVDMQATFADLRTVMNRLEERIGAILYNLEGSARNANEFTREIRENPGSLLRSSPQPERGVEQ